MRAAMSDIDALVDMRIAYIIADHGAISEDNKSKMKERLPIYFEKHLDRDLFGFIEKRGNKVVSAALLLVIEKPSNPNFINGIVGEVLSVYTVPEYRRQGISRSLMLEMLDFAKEKQLDFVELSATEDGYPLYKGVGFVEHTSPYVAMRYRFD